MCEIVLKNRMDPSFLDHGHSQGDGGKNHGRESSLDRGSGALGLVAVRGRAGTSTAGGTSITRGLRRGSSASRALAVSLVVARDNTWVGSVLGPLEVAAQTIARHYKREQTKS